MSGRGAAADVLEVQFAKSAVVVLVSGAASIINSHRPALYNYVDGGFVLDADAAQRCLLCSYPSE